MDNRKKDDYSFIKEVIKKKPVDKRAVLIKMGCIIGSAVLFGLVAAFVFASFLPVVEEKNEEPAQIEFEDDYPEDTSNGEPMPETADTEAAEGSDNTAAEIQNSADGEAAAEFGVEEYEKVYEEMNEIAQNAMHSMVTVTGITSSEDWFNTTTESTKQASGLIVANNGQELFILTEYRAVDTVDRVMVTFWDNTIVDCRYQKHDANTGLTIIKVSLKDMDSSTQQGVQAATLSNSYLACQGESVIAIGSPMGYSNSVVNGQITSTTNKVTSTDVEYNLLTTNILQFGSGDKSVITCLPISQLKPLIEILSNNGEIPSLGIQGQTVTAEIAKQTGMPRGIYVNMVNMDSPALQAGIQNADILIKFNGESVESMANYWEKLRKTSVGEEVTVTVMRKGAEGYVEFEFVAVTASQ